VNEKRCGAQTRAGTPCKRLAGKKGRCAMHGGKSTGPKTKGGKVKAARNAETHRIFSRVLNEDDLVYLEEMPEGPALLKVLQGFAYIQVIRTEAVLSKREAGDESAGTEKETDTSKDVLAAERSGGKEGTQKTKRTHVRERTVCKVPDLRGYKDRFLARVALLTLQKEELDVSRSKREIEALMKQLKAAIAEAKE
jgi:hypothetical protein